MEEEMAREEVKNFLKPHGGSTVNIKEDSFSVAIDDLSIDALNYLLEKLRGNRNFYKGILLEKYREKNPTGFRYQDAEKKLKIYNFQGKTTKSLIDSRS